VFVKQRDLDGGRLRSMAAKPAIPAGSEKVWDEADSVEVQY